MRRAKSAASAPRSPAMEMVIMTDRSRQAYVPSALLRATPAAASPPPPPPPQAADPVAEALQLIKADIAQQAQAAAGGEPPPKRPVTIRLEAASVRPPAPPSPPRPPRQKRQSPPPRPTPAAPSASIFDDDIEEYCLRVRRGGRRATAVSDRLGELLQRQRAVRRLQMQLRAQNAEMREEARQLEQEADAARRRHWHDTAGYELPTPTVPTTTATEALLVLRENGGCCGAADLCLTPRDLPHAVRVIHRLRCEVLELRASTLRAVVAKNEVTAQLNRERAQLRRTFTSAQLVRLLGIKRKGMWEVEDMRRAIAAHRVLTRRQYRYVAEVMKIPLPSLRYTRSAAVTRDAGTRQMYEQMVAEKLRKRMTRKRRLERPSAVSATRERRLERPSAVSATREQRVERLSAVSATRERRVERPSAMSAHHPDGLITVATSSSESDDGEEQGEDERPAPAPVTYRRRRLKLAVTGQSGQQRGIFTVAPPGLGGTRA